MNNLYPVKLRVTVNRKREYYPTIYDLSKDDYKKFSAPHINNELHQIRSNIQKIETSAKKIVDELQPFDLSQFENKFIVGNPLLKSKWQKRQPEVTGITKPDPVHEEFDFSPYEERFPIFKEESPTQDYIAVTFISYIKNLLMEGRIGTALSYRDAYTTLKQFRGNVPFSVITRQYLIQFERWMIDNNKSSKATVGIKLRSLRAVFNEAIDQELVKKGYLSFWKEKIQNSDSKENKEIVRAQ